MKKKTGKTGVNPQAQKRQDDLLLKMRLDKTARTLYNAGRFQALGQVADRNDLQSARLWFQDQHSNQPEYLRGFEEELDLWT